MPNRHAGRLAGGRGVEAELRGSEPTRKLTTILSADAAEFSRMMRADED
jgi:class 3 adenylate cyclase